MKQIPNMGPIISRVQPIRSPENPGTTMGVLDIEPHSLKPLDIALRGGVMNAVDSLQSVFPIHFRVLLFALVKAIKKNVYNKQLSFRPSVTTNKNKIETNIA